MPICFLVFRTIFSKRIKTDELVHDLTNNDFNLFKLGYKDSLKTNFKCEIVSIVEASPRLLPEILCRVK